MATGAAAAVVIVAGTAFAVLPNLTPAPPAETPTPTVTTSPTPTPTETSTPTPTVTPVVLPVGNPALPYGVCGSLADAAPAYPVDDRVVVRVTPATGTLPSGGFLAAGGVIERPTPVDAYLAYAVPDDGPSVAVVQDGVVVGTASFSPAAGDVMSGRSGYDGEVTSFDGLLGLTVCDPGDGGPVDRGTAAAGRDLRAAAVGERRHVRRPPEAPAELSQDALTFEQAAALGGAPATAVGEPTTVTVTGEAETQQPLPGSDVPLDTHDVRRAPRLRRTRTGRTGPWGHARPAGDSRRDDARIGRAPDRDGDRAVHRTGPAAPLRLRRDRVLGRAGRRRRRARPSQANDAFSLARPGCRCAAGVRRGRPGPDVVLTDGGYPLSTGDPLPAGEYTVYPAWIFNDPVVRTGIRDGGAASPARHLLGHAGHAVPGDPHLTNGSHLPVVQEDDGTTREVA